MDQNQFTRPPLIPSNLDRYLVRKRILQAILEARPLLCGTLLDIGCGTSPYRAILEAPAGKARIYIGLDSLNNPLYKNNPDIVWENSKIPLSDDSVDSILLTEVLEHCSNPSEILDEANRVLRRDGFCLVTVPFLWPLHDTPCDEYRYTPFSLERLAVNAGFEIASMRSLGDWDASLAQMIGLWIRRRKMNGLLRTLLSYAAFPIYLLLVILDNGAERAEYSSGPMITGLTALLRKK
ncbi:class I SAM-dependent methyltransferase [Cyanobium gracile]|uniref:class I SAM-dependent methyltransferase n=1 Tax=Cyanobium gracile TaxID=59930 RepID=UPI003A4C69B8